MYQQSEKMVSLGSKIRYKYNLPDCEIKTNLKLFYNLYPHCINLDLHHRYKKAIDNDPMSTDYWRLRQSLTSLKRSLKRNYSLSFVMTRIENYKANMRIYTTNLVEIMDHICDSKITLDDRPIKDYVSEAMIMEPEHLTKLQEKVPEYSSKTRNVLCKKLPWGKYRYKIYWATHASEKKKIGNDAMYAIEVQLRHCRQIKHSAALFTQMHQRYTSWMSTYFYAEDIDWMPIICLIDERFIKKIELYITQEELESTANV